jgi:hypothetical protein
MSHLQISISLAVPMGLLLLGLGLAYWLRRRFAPPPPPTEAELRAEAEAAVARLREHQQARRLEPERFTVRDLHTGQTQLFLGSAPCFDLHHGEVTETVRKVPPPADFYPALVGDLVRDPAGKGFAPGEPVRYWGPASDGQPVEVGVGALHLYEVLAPPPPAVTRPSAP